MNSAANQYSAPGEMLTTAQVSKLTGLVESTLCNMRSTGKGPPFYKMGGGKYVRYDYNELLAWMRSKRCVSTSQASA